MKVLLTGGTGLVGRGTVPWLLRCGHSVRVLSRHARVEVGRWSHPPGEVEAVDADVTVPESLRGVASGCSAVVHLVGLIEENPPEATYERVHVAGTGHLLAEAARAGVHRFVHVSSLGAGRPSSAFQRSKIRSEEVVRGFPGAWTIVRPSGVYGPRDQTVSLLLRILRGSPVVPLIGRGNQPVQFIWYRDLGLALTRALEREDLVGRLLQVAGEETTTSREIVEHFAALVGKHPLLLPIPAFLAVGGSHLAAWAGFTPPLNEAKLTMLLEGSVVEPPEANALSSVLGVRPMPLEEALRSILDGMPLQSIAQGFGPIHHKAFFSDIPTSVSPEAMIESFRRRCTEVMPLDLHTEPGTEDQLELGTTITMHLPVRGNLQMRVVEVGPTVLTMATVEGHPFAGTVRFSAARVEGGLRFRLDLYARASNVVDLMALRSFAELVQDAHWRRAVKQASHLVHESKHRVHVRRSAEVFRGPSAAGVQTMVGEIVERYERDFSAPWIADPIRRTSFSGSRGTRALLRRRGRGSRVNRR